METHEWISLIALESPRIDPDDRIDSALSRYASPGSPTSRIKLVKITWRGLLSPTWAHRMFVKALLATPPNQWLTYVVGGFGKSWAGESRDCTILKVPDTTNEYVLWEVA